MSSPPPVMPDIRMKGKEFWYPTDHPRPELRGQLTPLGVLFLLENWTVRHGFDIARVEKAIGKHPFKAWAVQQIRDCLMRECPETFKRECRAHDPSGTARDPAGNPIPARNLIAYLPVGNAKPLGPDLDHPFN